MSRVSRFDWFQVEAWALGGLMALGAVASCAPSTPERDAAQETADRAAQETADRAAQQPSNGEHVDPLDLYEPAYTPPASPAAQPPAEEP